MGKRPKKKVVLFIVEGPSDQRALETSFSEIYSLIDPDITVEFAIIDPGKGKNPHGGGDITTSSWVTPDNIDKKLYSKIIDPFLSREKYYAKDLFEIIQITDLDGAYIPDESVNVDPSATDGPIYKDNGIWTTNKDGIIARNQNKRDVTDKLVSMSEIKIDTKTIPYSLYFFSSNMDHYLNNDANLPWQKKIRKANDFSDNCMFGLEPFYKMFCDDQDALNMDWQESWDFIRAEGYFESIKRHTNLNILINSLKEKIE